MEGSYAKNKLKKSKIRQKLTKKPRFVAARGGAEGDAMELKTQNPQKAHLSLQRMYLPNFNFQAQFGEEIREEQNFFKVKKGTHPP